MKNIFKKTIRKKIHQRLDNYIDFQYEKYVLEVKNKSFTKKYQYEIQDLFKNYKSYCNKDIDGICLAIFLIEISYLSNSQAREENLNNEIKPILNDGASELMDAIKAFDLNALNIEEIVIKTKQPNDFITGRKVSTMDQKKR